MEHLRLALLFFTLTGCYYCVNAMDTVSQLLKTEVPPKQVTTDELTTRLHSTAKSILSSSPNDQASNTSITFKSTFVQKSTYNSPVNNSNGQTTNTKMTVKSTFPQDTTLPSPTNHSNGTTARAPTTVKSAVSKMATRSSSDSESVSPKPSISSAVPLCAPNMVFTTCTTCQGSCADPTNCTYNCSEPEVCICPAGFLMSGNYCIPEENCGCYLNEVGVLPINDTYVSLDCSTQCICNNDQLSCKFNSTCSSAATCREEGGIRGCHCNDSYIGDGGTCMPIYTDCYDAYEAGNRQDGVYTILPNGWSGTPFDVYCVMSTNGGGWTVFQRRINGSVDFYRDWDAYKTGFGSPNHELWLGNDKLYHMTSQKTYELLIYMLNKTNMPLTARYSHFRIGDENDKYKVYALDYVKSDFTVNGLNRVKGSLFSTRDMDNDGCEEYSCAEKHGSGWWFKTTGSNRCRCLSNDSNCRRFTYGNGTCSGFCTTSNLNGVYGGDPGLNINWRYDANCDPTFVEMKIRPV